MRKLFLLVLCFSFIPSYLFSKEKERYYNLSPSLWTVKLSTSQISEIKQKISQLPVIRGIHLTSWVAGNKKQRTKVLENIRKSVINSVVVAVKEKNGDVYIPGIDITYKYKTYVSAISNPKEMIEDFKKEKLYTIARVVCFHDNKLPKIKPDIAVKNVNGGVWKSKNGDMWVDPYNKEVWEYIISVAEKASEYGFDEIQFDYIRYPTEGDVKLCSFSVPHSNEDAENNIVDFIKYAKERLSKYNVKISVDVFGLTTKSSMGIGQNLKKMIKVVDRVYPMMYPSHYYSGEYNLIDPEREPYKLINRALKQAMNMVEVDYYKIVPYLQDFSLSVRYGPFELRAQIIAAKNNYIKSFLLWNPASKYLWETLTPQAFCAYIEPQECYKIND